MRASRDADARIYKMTRNGCPTRLNQRKETSVPIEQIMESPYKIYTARRRRRHNPESPNPSTPLPQNRPHRATFRTDTRDK